jgi:DNA-binding Lrp family transcriptional regulator
MNIDALDEKLLSILRDNARQSAEKLAKRLKVSPTTVRRRMKKLTRSGMVMITPMVDPAKIGLTVRTYIAVDVELGDIESATGRFDLVLGAGFRSTADLSEFMQRKMAGIKGLKDIEVFVCLEMKKGRYVPY